MNVAQCLLHVVNPKFQLNSTVNLMNLKLTQPQLTLISPLVKTLKITAPVGYPVTW